MAGDRSNITPELGRTLIILGIVILVLGVLFTFGGRIPWLGNLPGDIHIQRGRFSFYFPIATCIVISAVISLVLYLFRR
jgi:Protein of unknown function (DUF2905)